MSQSNVFLLFLVLFICLFLDYGLEMAPFTLALAVQVWESTFKFPVLVEKKDRHVLVIPVLEVRDGMIPETH